jgi:hypothetical protein
MPLETTKDLNAIALAEALADPGLSAEARTYLESFTGAADKDGRMNVLESSNGDSKVHYGDYVDGTGTYDGLNVPLEWVIEAARTGGSAPSEWDNAWDLVEVSADNAYGYAFLAREYLPAQSAVTLSPETLQAIEVAGFEPVLLSDRKNPQQLEFHREVDGETVTLRVGPASLETESLPLLVKDQDEFQQTGGAIRAAVFIDAMGGANAIEPLVTTASRFTLAPPLITIRPTRQ